MVEVHEVSEFSAWGVYACGSHWVVDIHVRHEVGVKDSDWVWGSTSGCKADNYHPLGLVDQCLVKFRGLVCVLFGSEELVCIRGWGITIRD